MEEDVQSWIRSRELALKSTTQLITEVSVEIMGDEFQRIMSNKDVQKYESEKVIPYLYIASFLSYSGRDINKDSMTNVAKAVGLDPDDGIIDTLLETNMKSHLVYVYAYYLLLLTGMDTSEANIIAILRAMGINGDIYTAMDILKYVH